MLQLDSLSRYDAWMKFPALLKGLRAQSFPAATAIEYSRHHISGYNSIPNMEAIYCAGNCDNEAENIFAIYKATGFKVLFTENLYEHYPTMDLDRYADRVFHENFFGLDHDPLSSDFGSFGCFEGGFQEERLVAYLESTIERSVSESGGVGMFSLSNFLESHSSNHLDTAILDRELTNMLSRFDSNGILARSIVVIYGDHGLHYPLESFDSVVKHRNPFLTFMIGHESSVDSDTWIAHLRRNKDRPTGHADLHATLVALSGSQYTADRGLNLTSVEVPHDRRCQDTDIPDPYCPCFIEAFR